MNINPGFLLINKPAGRTSFDCIRKLQRIFGKDKKFGHSGTLDPFATGLLIVALGREATRHVDEIMQLDKEYVATGKLGELTDTFDLKGQVVEMCPIPVPLNSSPQLSSGQAGRMFENAFNKLMPSYLQTPPIYSALWHEGKRLYDIARKGKTSQEEINEIIARKIRTVFIHKLELLECNPPLFKIRAHVSHGTYIRSLVNDIARLLGSCATTVALERTQIGPFKVGDAIVLPEREAGVNVAESIIPVDEFLGRMKSQKAELLSSVRPE